MRPFELTIVDDDVMLRQQMIAHGFVVTQLRSLNEALERIDAASCDAVLLELEVRDGNGMSLLQSLAARGIEVPVVVWTARPRIDLAVEAVRLGAEDFLDKATPHDVVVERVTRAAGRGRLRRDTRQALDALGNDPHHLVGVSAGIERVRAAVDRVGPTDVTVSITGEAGTEKRQVARALHARASRPSRLVVIDCEREAAPPLSHVTDLADTTFFLEEVGKASPALQAWLLRSLPGPARFITSTSVDLSAVVGAGRMREELMYRLRVVPIHLPPLRQRRDDVPLLASVLVHLWAREHDVPAPRLSDRTLAALSQKEWPGNVEQLSGAIERLLASGRYDVESDELGAIVDGETRSRATTESPEWWVEVSERFVGEDQVPPLREARAEFERAYVRQLLRATNGNVAAAARLARRNRSEFYALMKRHRITSPRRACE